MASKSKQSNKPGLARKGATLMIRGIAKCFGGRKSSSGRKPSRAKSRGRAPSRKRAAKTQKALVKLAKKQISGEMVLFDARVVKTLPDDNHGDRHQRFIVAIEYMPSPVQTVLITHNIDLAPRIPVERGSIVRLYGQYEYTNRGGLLHWTHHDPSIWREGGWIELHGKRYD